MAQPANQPANILERPCSADAAVKARAPDGVSEHAMTTISPYLGHALRRIATGYSVDCRIIAGREYWFLWHHSGACTPMISRTAAKGAYLRLAMQSLHTTNA